MLAVCVALASPSAFALDAVPAAASTTAAPAADGDVTTQLRAALRHLAVEDVDAARAIVEPLLETRGHVPSVRAVAGVLRFHEQRYGDAVKLFSEAGAAASGLPEAELAQATLAATKDLARAESAHFTLSAAKGSDEILAAVLLPALEAERARLAGTGIALKERKLPVVVAADQRALDRLTTLDAKDVASGHAAACEYGKLVIASPRAAVGGYPWVDAAVHEYARCAGAPPEKRGRPGRVPLRWKGDAKAAAPEARKAGLAQDHARLGDILRARGRNVPARLEYEKALRRGGESDPEIVARYARTAFATGSAAKAEAPLRDAAREHPRHAGVLAALGKVELEREAFAPARDAFAAALRVDPFDADVHGGLAKALEKLGDATGASRHARFAEMLQR